MAKCPKCDKPIFRYQMVVNGQRIRQRECGCGRMVEREGQRRFVARREAEDGRREAEAI